MAQKKYRTSQGKMVDFSAMLTNNELTPALGNMNVNARGDEIQPDGTIVKSREDVMREYYKMNTTVPEEAPIPEGNVATADNIPEDNWADWEPKQEATTEQPVQEKIEEAIAPPTPKVTNVAQMVEETGGQKVTPTGSLASSVAGTKTITGVDKSKFEAPSGLKRL